MACAVASDFAQPGDEIVLDNHGVVKATPVPRKGVVKHQDYRDPGYRNVTTKNLTVRWTPGHHDLNNATTYQGYVDIQGKNDSDIPANMGDNLPMDMPPPQPQDIVLHHAKSGQVMDYAITATKTNDGRTLDKLDPVDTSPAVDMAPLVVGPGPLVGTGSTLGAHPNRVRVLRPQTWKLGANAAGALPFLDDFLDRAGDMVERLGGLCQELVAYGLRTRQVALVPQDMPQLDVAAAAVHASTRGKGMRSVAWVHAHDAHVACVGVRAIRRGNPRLGLALRTCSHRLRT